MTFSLPAPSSLSGLLSAVRDTILTEFQPEASLGHDRHWKHGLIWACPGWGEASTLGSNGSVRKSKISKIKSWTNGKGWIFKGTAQRASSGPSERSLGMRKMKPNLSGHFQIFLLHPVLRSQSTLYITKVPITLRGVTVFIIRLKAF